MKDRYQSRGDRKLKLWRVKVKVERFKVQNFSKANSKLRRHPSNPSRHSSSPTISVVRSLSSACLGTPQGEGLCHLHSDAPIGGYANPIFASEFLMSSIHRVSSLALFPYPSFDIHSFALPSTGSQFVYCKTYPSPFLFLNFNYDIFW